MENKTIVVKQINSYATIDGIICTFDSKKIRSEIENIIKEKSEFILLSRFTYELRPSNFHGHVAKIKYKMNKSKLKDQGININVKFDNLEVVLQIVRGDEDAVMNFIAQIRDTFGKSEKTLELEAENNDIVFHTHEGTKEVLKFTEEGEVFVFGEKIGEDKQAIFEGFEYFLNQAKMQQAKSMIEEEKVYML